MTQTKQFVMCARTQVPLCKDLIELFVDGPCIDLFGAKRSQIRTNRIGYPVQDVI